jgi:membrane-associated phospholipid phosphatase
MYNIIGANLPTFSNTNQEITTLLFIAVIMLLMSLSGFYMAIYLFQRSFLCSRLKALVCSLQKRYPELYILIGFLISGLMLAEFAQLAWKTLFRHQMDVFDQLIIGLVRHFANQTLDAIMLGITTLGSAPFYGALSLLLLAGLAFYRKWLEASTLAICLLGGGLLNYLLKHLFMRARPDMFHVIKESGYSFPSGHAMVSLCFYGMIAYFISRNISSWALRFVLFVLTAIYIVTIGISRIYLGAHYPTDVLAGYAAGSTWLFFCISLLMWWEHKKIHKQQSINKISPIDSCY